MSQRCMRSLAIAVIVMSCGLARSAETALKQAMAVDTQPLIVQCRRLVEALDFLGAPLGDSAKHVIDQATRQNTPEAVREAIQAVLDPLCVAEVEINPESRVRVNAGPARCELDQNGWRVFLVKVHNAAGVTAVLKAHSPQALPVAGADSSEVSDRWLDLIVFNDRPLSATLSGIELEYRPLLIYSRDAGKRSAVIAFDVGQGTQDIGFRNDVTLTFECRPAIEVELHISDEHGAPTTAALEIRDRQNHVYPSPMKRIAPDMHFHPQVYRRDGETVSLPPGEYQIQSTRGPEYLPQTQTLRVTADTAHFRVRMRRWIDPSAGGWWSGDHHIHAAGCGHYSKPTEGVHALDMIRQCQGEDLKIGANLTWGPCFDYQKQFFTGSVDAASTYPYLLRYDVEVSGFGSHESGHLCLLRLRQQMYPGGDSTSHWPTLGLNTLRWAQTQGAVCGPAHSGLGLEVDSDQLPNYVVPPFDGIGANEYIVDVTHQVEGPDGTDVPAIDFISLCDTPMISELNIWYHTLNCGFRTRVSGETDFPCVYGERVGMGRSYVKLPGKLTYDDWCEGISRGASYVSDGRSHLMNMTARHAAADREAVSVSLGENDSELSVGDAGNIIVNCDVAALLPEASTGEGRRPFTDKPYWHLERARIGQTREVLVELIVNGLAISHQRIAADGSLQHLFFETQIDRSSWVAVRIFGSSHTNPVFIIVGNQPIRASARSAQWCLDGVERCWEQKQRFLHPAERSDAEAAYEHARIAYQQILTQSN